MFFMTGIRRRHCFRRVPHQRYDADSIGKRRSFCIFVYEENGTVLASAIINQSQVYAYKEGDWQYPAPTGQVMVLHTLTVSPAAGKRGIGISFVAFYENQAASRSCPYLRMDTNAINTRARALYKSLGYREIRIIPCTFNGIPDITLILLEKKL